jgi:Domain of unknown function (DUF4411)
MLYLIDANVLITAHNDYYPIDGVPEFWDWLLHQATIDTVKMPLEIYEEIKLALQLRFLKGSESMGNHDSKIVDACGVD